MFNRVLFISWLGMLINLLQPIFIMPLALEVLSDVEVSIWLFMMSLISLGLLADLGLSPTLIRTVSYFYNGANKIDDLSKENIVNVNNEPNWSEIYKVIKTTKNVYFYLSLISVIIVLLLGVPSIFNLMDLNGHKYDGWLALLILACGIGLQIFMVRCSALLQGVQEIYRVKRIELFVAVIRLVISVVLLYVMESILGVVLGYMLGGVVGLVCYNVILWSVFSVGLDKKYGKYDSKVFYSLLSRSWKLGVIFLGGFLIFNGSVFIVSQMDDVVFIASYLITLRLILVLKQFAFLPVNLRIPAITSCLVKSDLKSMRNETINIVSISFVVYFVGGVFLYLFGDGIIVYVLGERKLLDGELMLFLLVIYFLELHHSLHATIFITSNNIPFVVPTIVSGVLIVFLGYIWLALLGGDVWGMLIVQAVIQLAHNNWYPVYLSLKLQRFGSREYFSMLCNSILRVSYLKRLK